MAFTPSIEPMLPDPLAIRRSELPELCEELERRAARLHSKLNPVLTQVLADHMMAVNAYYSNLIEGESVCPIEVRSALAGSYSGDPDRRDLQLEAVAHVGVQQWLTEHVIPCDRLYSANTVMALHRELYRRLPESRRIVSGDDGGRVPVKPGVFRDRMVQVGGHLPPPPGEIDRYLSRLDEAYGFGRLSGESRLIGIMASHHRLAWIHPFLDGNGRVGRLHTDLLLREAGVGGVWSLSRGLAYRSADYKAALARADFPRQGNYDGRGARSQGNLVAFCEFMLRVAIDQVDYTDGLLSVDGMRRRIRGYVEARTNGQLPGMGHLRPEASALLERAYAVGELPPEEVVKISGLSQEEAIKLSQQLNEEGLLTQYSPASSLRWAVPGHAEPFYLPGLSTD